MWYGVYYGVVVLKAQRFWQMLYCLYIQSHKGYVHGNDHHYPAEIYAVIGRAVSELIASGKALDKKSVLLTLHAHSEQASESRLKDIYQQAFRYLLESFH
ncbi:hypothetical protein VRB69_12745 [Erwinia aphidicola]|uniref:hypothetical protein n=1 Tax=Erwinia aphidicola TaxID=68334 RepID=UPI0030CDA926